MTRGKADVIVYLAAFVVGAVISVLNNPLTGAAALLVCVSGYEFSYQLPRLVKSAKRR